jgi:hypothetical protein
MHLRIAELHAVDTLPQRLDRSDSVEEDFMSFVTVQPELLTATADSLQAVGAAFSAGNASAAAPTMGVIPAAADEVSALTAAQFAAHACVYQALSAQAVAIHQMFVAALAASAGSYAATETANAIATS